jgi:hypothetical protein
MKFSAIAIAYAAMSVGVNGFAVNNRGASFAVRNVSHFLMFLNVRILGVLLLLPPQLVGWFMGSIMWTSSYYIELYIFCFSG